MLEDADTGAEKFLASLCLNSTPTTVNSYLNRYQLTLSPEQWYNAPEFQPMWVTKLWGVVLLFPHTLRGKLDNV